MTPFLLLLAIMEVTMQTEPHIIETGPGFAAPAAELRDPSSAGPRRVRAKSGRERVFIRRVLKGKLDAKLMGRALGMSLDGLARWLNQPAVRELVRGVERLSEFQMQVHLKPQSLQKLGAMVQGTQDPSETLRRVCNDLLSLPPAVDPAGVETIPAAAPNEWESQELRQLYQTMGGMEISQILARLGADRVESGTIGRNPVSIGSDVVGLGQIGSDLK
jgi:hypothetical protein